MVHKVSPYLNDGSEKLSRVEYYSHIEAPRRQMIPYLTVSYILPTLNFIFNM